MVRFGLRVAGACALWLSLSAVQAQALTLADALRIGEAQSPQLMAQRHALEASAQLLGRAAELPDPKLRLGLENLPVTGPLSYRTDRDFMTMRTIGLVQEFPNQAKRAARGARSERLHDLEQASLVAQRTRLRRDIALGWFELHYARRMQAALESLVAQVDLQAEAIAAGIARGRHSAADGFMLRGAAEQARDRVLEQARLVDRARVALAVWLGEAASRPLDAPPDTARLTEQPAKLLARLQDLPQLRVFVEREQLALAEAELARSTRRSDWSLQVGFAQREPNFSNMLSVMVAMDLPWQTERRQDKDIAARLSDLERVRAQRDDVRRALEGEILAWSGDFETADRRLRRFVEVQLPLARDRVEASLAAYRGGRGELAAVLEARRAHADVELARIGAEAQRARAWANLSFLFPTESDR